MNETTLVYVGSNVGNSLWGIFDKFDRVYAFEPDPEIFEQLNRRFGQFEWVTLVNAACSNFEGKSKLHVTPNRVSTSLSDASEDEKSLDTFSQKVIKVIDVDVINLGNYLKKEGVDEIEFYYSDAQGSDLNILKTLKENYLDTKQIQKMFIETHGDGVQIYEGLYNQLSGFKELLSENYSFVHASLGSQDGKIVKENEIPKDEKEWDSYWEVK